MPAGPSACEMRCIIACLELEETNKLLAFLWTVEAVGYLGCCGKRKGCRPPLNRLPPVGTGVPPARHLLCVGSGRCAGSCVDVQVTGKFRLTELSQHR